MKFLRLYKSLLFTFVKSSIRLSAVAVLISVFAVYSVICTFCCFLSTFSEMNKANLNIYLPEYYNCEKDSSGFVLSVKNTNVKELFSVLSDMPEIIDYKAGVANLLHTSSDSRFFLSEYAYVLYPDEYKDVYRYINPEYTVYEGRDFSEDEAQTCNNTIIASKLSNMKIGETFTVLCDKGNIDLTVIGISDEFVMPLSFFEKYGYALYYTDNNRKQHETNKNCDEIIFERNLTDEELARLDAASLNLYVKLPDENDYASDYVLIIPICIVFCIMTALQVYSMFLYLAKKSQYHISIMKITGCKNSTVLVLTLLVTLTYILAALVIAILCMPLLTELTMKFRLNYVPCLSDFVIAFVFYSVVVLAAVFPGLRSIVSKPLAKVGEIL